MERVYIPIPVEAVRKAQELPSRTYCLDLDRGRIAGMVDGQEAVRQAIRKALITPRFRCLIYDHQYGSEITEAITAQDATREYAAAAIPGFIRDCLKPDTRITGVGNFSVTFEGDAANISFDADTVFGQIHFEEVVK